MVQPPPPECADLRGTVPYKRREYKLATGEYTFLSPAVRGYPQHAYEYAQKEVVMCTAAASVGGLGYCDHEGRAVEIVAG